MILSCPICKKAVQYQGNPWRPFCSEKCKMIDLGKWVLEDYRIRDDEPQ